MDFSEHLLHSSVLRVYCRPHTSPESNVKHCLNYPTIMKQATTINTVHESQFNSILSLHFLCLITICARILQFLMIDSNRLFRGARINCLVEIPNKEKCYKSNKTPKCYEILLFIMRVIQ